MKRWKKIALVLLALAVVSQVPFAYRSYRLRRVEYVPGVLVSGTIPIEGGSATLTVSGKAAAHGKLTYHPDGLVTGTLDGHRISVHPAVRAAQAVSRPLSLKLPRHRRVLQLG